jgi:hypothetical protein
MAPPRAEEGSYLLAERKDEAKVRRDTETRFPQIGIRERLLRRREEQDPS